MSDQDEKPPQDQVPSLSAPASKKRMQVYVEIDNTSKRLSPSALFRSKRQKSVSDEFSASKLPPLVLQSDEDMADPEESLTIFDDADDDDFSDIELVPGKEMESLMKGLKKRLRTKVLMATQSHD